MLSIEIRIMVLLLVISIASATAMAIVYLQTPPSSNILIMASGSMCVTYDGACPGRLSPNEPTLHIGDYIVFQTVDPQDLNVDYPNSDIIVFHKPNDPDELIVHRIAAVDEADGKLYFRTKGDGNGLNKWPNTPQESEYDPWGPVSQDQVVGKVVNTNLPFELLTISFWTLLGLSVATGIAVIIMFVSSRWSKKRNNRIEELEERIRRLEAEKEQA